MAGEIIGSAAAKTSSKRGDRLSECWLLTLTELEKISSQHWTLERMEQNTSLTSECRSGTNEMELRKSESAMCKQATTAAVCASAGPNGGKTYSQAVWEKDTINTRHFSKYSIRFVQRAKSISPLWKLDRILPCSEVLCDALLLSQREHLQLGLSGISRVFNWHSRSRGHAECLHCTF